MKNTQKGFIVPLLIGIVALLIIGSGAYIYINHSKSQVQTTNNEESGGPVPTLNDYSNATSSASTTNTVSTPGPDNWKTYNFGVFNFQYPSDWVVDLGNDGNLTIFLPNRKTPSETIGEAVFLEGRHASCDSQDPHCFYISNNAGGVFDLKTNSTNPSTLDIYSKILASLKVNGEKAAIRQAGPSTEGWKTYANGQYGFQFQYPNNAQVDFIDHVPPHGTDLSLGFGENINFIVKDGSIYYPPNHSVDNEILTFFVFQKPEPNLENELRQEFSGFSNVTLERIQINGLTAIKVKYNAGTATASTRIWIQNSYHVYAFNFSDKSTSFAMQILNSFKFTAPGTD